MAGFKKQMKLIDVLKRQKVKGSYCYKLLLFFFISSSSPPPHTTTNLSPDIGIVNEHESLVSLLVFKQF